jgi:hypothetical protein
VAVTVARSKLPRTPAPRASIDIDTKVLAMIASSVRRWRHMNPGVSSPSIVAIDSGSAIAGWCYIDENGDSCSGQGSPREVEGAVINATFGRPSPALFAREGPYTTTMATMQSANAGGPVGLYRLGVAAGFITRGIFDVIRNAAMWEPMPTQWRSVHGLNRKRTEGRTAKENTNAAVIEWVRAKTGRVFRTSTGRDAVDEAMAAGLAFAALSVARAAERTEL